MTYVPDEKKLSLTLRTGLNQDGEGRLYAFQKKRKKQIATSRCFWVPELLFADESQRRSRFYSKADRDNKIPEIRFQTLRHFW